MQTFTYGNGIIHTTTQNARQLPEQSTDTGVFDDKYLYDENANISSIVDLLPRYVRTRVMTYDDLDRLITTASPMWRRDAMFSSDELDNTTYMSSLIRTGLKVYRAGYYCYAASWRRTKLKPGSCGSTTVLAHGYEDKDTRTK